MAAFDECHMLPANTFSRFATVKAKYRLGLCLHPRTKITLDSGNVLELRKLIKRLKNKEEIKVLTYNNKLKKIEPKEITNFYEKEMRDLLKISIKTKKGVREIICSPDHQFFVRNKYIKASNLKKGDITLLLNQPHSTYNNATKNIEVSKKMIIEEGKIIKIEKVKNNLKKVYDLEVKNNHNFFANKDRKSTRLNSSHTDISRMPSSA